MAEQTTSSIVIDAPPAEVMAVIADFESYPSWATGVTTADVTVQGADGRAEQVYFALDVTPIKDEYTLVYDWDGDRQVTLDPRRGQDAQGTGRLLRASRHGHRFDRGHLLPGARRLDPADRHAQAQGREDPHRRGAQGPEEARRVALSTQPRRVRILLFTGKGGVGKSTIAAGTATLSAASGHRTLVLSTDAAHSLADAFGAPAGAEPTEVSPGLFVQQVDAQLRFEQSWAEIQSYLLRVLDVAGVDPGRCRGTCSHPRGGGSAGPARAAGPGPQR
ncbi:ArsA-related P-loop ATPase [Nocardioides sp. B-3]|uniref:ArsA-related P-loop ATPase n=1 Tax=Nocardioides sp. B-3 TaxID=2895565 RepID=UPI00215300EF|nr:ArsA-related P-loop ATPase [Nocardioides sp. B-3]